MMQTKGFLNYLKQNQPALFSQLVLAEQEGLVVIDEDTDSVTATNRLLWNYPGLHKALSVIVNQWAENLDHSSQEFKKLIHGGSLNDQSE